MRRIDSLLNNAGHIVAIKPHHCRFGDTFQPVCIEDDCGYVGPFVNEERAHAAIATEHRRKSCGIWKAAK